MPVNMLLLGSQVSKYFLSGRMIYERASRCVLTHFALVESLS